MPRPAVVTAISVAALIIAAAVAWRVLARPGISSVLSISATRPSAKIKPEEADATIKRSEDRIAKYPDAPASEEAYLDLAGAYEAKGELPRSKEAYRKFIEKFPSSNSLLKAQESLDGINVRMLFARDVTPGSVLYEVQKGDNLTRISKKFNTTVELFAKTNNIKGDAVRAGMKLKVPTVRFSIVVDKSQNILTLKADGDVFKTYRVSTGKSATPTPAGTFKITNKIVDPPWYPPGRKAIPSGDPKNVLGSRWLGLSEPSYGLHGTIDPDSIGQSVTEGCVRLKNADVEELYSIVPEGTEVVIVD